MVRIAMIATQFINRQGIFAGAGERFDVTPIQAAMLKYRKLARFATAEDTPPPPDPEPEPELPPIAAAVEPTRPARRRRSYRTREMKAER